MKVAAPPLGGTTKSPRRGSYKPSAEPVVMTMIKIARTRFISIHFRVALICYMPESDYLNWPELG